MTEQQLHDYLAEHLAVNLRADVGDGYAALKVELRLRHPTSGEWELIDCGSTTIPVRREGA
jgi:hypothetical protein